MKNMVTGKFKAEQQAVSAINKLLGSCIPSDHVHTFFLTPSPRQPDFDLEVGPHAAAGGVEVTAYMGSISRTSGIADAAEERAQSTGIMVAVETSDSVSQALAAKVLREHGAHAVERAAAPQDAPWPGLDPVPLSSLIRLR